MLRVAFCLLVLLAGTAAAEPLHELRVCADPNNLPFSNERGEGFENKIVELIAADLGVPVAYTWWPQRRGYIRNTLKAGLCDLIPGVPSALEMLAATAPYYRSGYVFVTRAADGPGIESFDDPRLRTLRIGVQMIGDDFANTPPAHALSRRGIIGNVTGYMVYGDYGRDDGAGGIVAAVATGAVDVAVVWGPVAGYFAKHQPVPLILTPTPPVDGPRLPMAFDISMGIRRGESDFFDRISEALERNHAAIDAILADYGVPRLDPPGRGL
ncbi:substrate-binding domain-containing protein [Azospirillum soli]|uniref:substrate-binding domain-containing protein n=1 Tax=Azospirillum soli TaxID=1304799 RepID=UPI001AE47D59|nr:substrate-binding domain-containing protein [Azospirillum soli]MBP2312152.1 mxaJ protein [Azospirillum soli]